MEEGDGRNNGCPTQDFAACRLDASGARAIVKLRWGLIPGWARDAKMGARLINARSETVHERPAFRAAFRRRRCLIPVDGRFSHPSNVGDAPKPKVGLTSKLASAQPRARCETPTDQRRCAMTRRTAALATCLALSLTAAAQETTTAEDVRTVIADVRDGRLDDVPMTGELAKVARGQKKKDRRRHAKNFKRFGALENVTFWETFDAVDLYLTAFERARVVIAIARSGPDGPFRHFRYRSVQIAKPGD